MDPAQSEMDVSTAWVICWVANSETKIFLTITPNNPTSDTTCGKADRNWPSGKSGGYTRIPMVRYTVIISGLTYNALNKGLSKLSVSDKLDTSLVDRVNSEFKLCSTYSLTVGE